MEGTAKPSKNPFLHEKFKYPTTHISDIEEWEEFLGTFEANPRVKEFVTDAVSSTEMFIYIE
jgi:hypothetical protein